MKIKYLAHSSFLITADDGTKVITDPYTAGQGFKYAPIEETADIVTVSHDHGDHNNTAGIKGNPQVVRESGTYKGITFKAVPTAHDASGGGERGKNTVMIMVVNGVRVVHLGDLGHFLTDNQVTEIHKVHVLLVPVGGFFTIDAATATEVAEQVRARVIIPMHYKTAKSADLPIEGVDAFLKNKDNVVRVGGSEVEFTVPTLPAGPQFMVLDPSL
jgi:L-ascorbate metabolism protein UlaG (beta-lactamase superfamily)